jgi:eukaryotic-like serine/threonine-protein kinase
MTRIAPSIRHLLDRAPDERRLGPFQLVEQLGRGGFAPVWLAREVYGATALRTAAVKLFSLRTSASDAEEIAVDRDRIVEEARALCQVEHPNVVRFYSLPLDEDLGVVGLAMEHIAGTALDRRLTAHGSLSIAETIGVGTAVASALSAVHHAGLVHRDVKPGNVVETAGVYKLIDFGIAAAEAKRPQRPRGSYALRLNDLSTDAVGEKMSSAEGELFTPQGDADGATVRVDMLSGTIGYIDPTCVSLGMPATAASDLYALGALLFECLIGKVPAAACAPPGKGLKGDVLDGRAIAPSVRDLRAETPSDLAQLVDALLNPDQGLRTASAEWVATRLEQIRTELAGTRRALPPESVGPFRGLGQYKEGDRDVYFGRSSEIAAALETLRSRGLVALVGPSGSGKSSLARAGILPAVAEGALGWPKRWDTAVAEPGQDPNAALGAALSDYVPNAASMNPDAIAVALAKRAQTTGWGLVLLIDQLEELVTVADPAGKSWAAALIARMADQAVPGVRLIVTARRDMLDPLLGIGDLGRVLLRRSVLIEPINEIVWADVLDQALAAYGYGLEDEGLKAELGRDLQSSSAAMPLIQFALTELWGKRDTARKKVTRAGLRAIGGIAGALERHADSTLRDLANRNGGSAAKAARRVLLALTTPQGTRATRPRAELLDTAGAGGQEAIRVLEEARLITPGPYGMTLAHEALLTQWSTLRGWVAEARETRTLAAELESDAARWRASPTVAPLWRGHRLRAGEALRRRGEQAVSDDAEAFLKAGRWAERRARLLASGFALGVVFALLIVGILYVAGQRRERAAAEASQREAERQAKVAEVSRREAERRTREAEVSRGRAEESRKEAEEQQRKVEAQQAEIASLLETLDKERDKSARLVLERRIRQRLQEGATSARQPRSTYHPKGLGSRDSLPSDPLDPP